MAQNRIQFGDSSPLLERGMVITSTPRQLKNGTFVHFDERTSRVYRIYTDPAAQSIKRANHSDVGVCSNPMGSLLRNINTWDGAVRELLRFNSQHLKKVEKHRPPFFARQGQPTVQIGSPTACLRMDSLLAETICMGVIRNMGVRAFTAKYTWPRTYCEYSLAELAPDVSAHGFIWIPFETDEAARLGGITLSAFGFQSIVGHARWFIGGNAMVLPKWDLR